MASVYLHKRSTTAGAVPSGTQLADGEIGLNTNDGKAFLKRADGTYVPIGSVVYGSVRASPQTISTAGTITLGKAARQVIFVKGNSGPVDGVLLPTPSSGVEEITLIGTNNTDTLTIADASNVEMNGPCLLQNSSVIRFLWDGTSKWIEVCRNDI